ncbi:MAG TPA: hypothetical protein VJZ00_04650 [Thermoanaerobaculia bacterium]|nr:hypothetical protein [Thermoanaerobaculia bacterium]
MRLVLITQGVDEEAEELVRKSGKPWLILRTGPVFGPRDEFVAPMLKKIRALPAVPVANGDEELQPIWQDDLAKIIGAALRRADVSGQVLDARGPEITTKNEIFDRLREITGLARLRVPVPSRKQADDAPHVKHAAEVFGIDMTPLDHALRVLADALPETELEDGVGALLHRTFWADIEGSSFTAAALLLHFREHFDAYMPLRFEAEPDTPKRLDAGATLTGKLPVRGHFQVRVKVAEPHRVLLATIEGHPLAGTVEFRSEETERGIRFTIEVVARATNALDWLALQTIGEAAEGANWRVVVERVVNTSGGTSDGVHESTEKLPPPERAT